MLATKYVELQKHYDIIIMGQYSYKSFAEKNCHFIGSQKFCKICQKTVGHIIKQTHHFEDAYPVDTVYLVARQPILLDHKIIGNSHPIEKRRFWRLKVQQYPPQLELHIDLQYIIGLIMGKQQFLNVTWAIHSKIYLKFNRNNSRQIWELQPKTFKSYTLMYMAKAATSYQKGEGSIFGIVANLSYQNFKMKSRGVRASFLDFLKGKEIKYKVGDLLNVGWQYLYANWSLKYCNINYFKVKRMTSQRKYAKITLDTRRRLIDLVKNEGYSFKKAADVLNINQSTARMIVRKYENDGVLFEKKDEKFRRVEVEKAIQLYREEKQMIKDEPQPQETTQPQAQPLTWENYLQLLMLLRQSQ